MGRKMVPQRPNPRDLGFYYSLAHVGLEMVVPMGLGVLVDIYLGTLPWITLIGAVLGPVVGFLHLLNLLNRHKQADSDQKDQDSQ